MRGAVILMRVDERKILYFHHAVVALPQQIQLWMGMEQERGRGRGRVVSLAQLPLELAK